MKPELNKEVLTLMVKYLYEVSYEYHSSYTPCFDFATDHIRVYVYDKPNNRFVRNHVVFMSTAEFYKAIGYTR